MTNKAQRINEVQQCLWQPLVLMSGKPGQEEMDLVGGENLWSGGLTKQCLKSKPAEYCECNGCHVGIHEVSGSACWRRGT